MDGITVFLGIVLFAVIPVTSCVADSTTLRHCATKGEAKLVFASATIKCEVRKEVSNE